MTTLKNLFARIAHLLQTRLVRQTNLGQGLFLEVHLLVKWVSAETTRLQFLELLTSVPEVKGSCITLPALLSGTSRAPKPIFGPKLFHLASITNQLTY